MKVVARSAKETQKIAEGIAKKILKSKPGKWALILALSGELGAGKTTFVQGFFRGLGLKARATSPTFIIFRRHHIPKNPVGYANVFHMDAYRLSGGKDLAPLGFNEIIGDPKNILLIEWADNIKRALPRGAKWIKLSHGKEKEERTLIL